ncbi:uncharacterized protein LOC105834845 [Monomorium pharaonis]|uniref:uncharacterized protein LOC105834845 n=1 Tax=Monomorium pharaonis TaxID=307658 RepID=UPI00063EDC95|nr:uncharacterized protein LOC105834845 [Monomorium pharaonis]
MRHSTPTKGSRCIKVVDPQKRGMAIPSAILHIVRPVSIKQNHNTSPSSENRHQILRAQNYRNNPALLLSETPLHPLYDPLEKSLEVKRIGHWKSKNQSTRYTIFEKTDSSSIKKTSISQNSRTPKRLSHREKISALQFPNRVPALQSELLTDNKDLRKASSRSIKLSRKCNLSQMKKSQMKQEDILALLPKIEAISSVIRKPIVSLPSKSTYNIVDITSTLSSCKIENKKTFANIVNKAKSISSTVSNHLHSSNSEYEINVLHYENDFPLRSNCPQFAQSHSKSDITNWSSVYNCDLVKSQTDNLTNERNAIKDHKCNEGKTVDDIKYSWEMNNWMPLPQRKETNACEIKIAERNARGPYDCKIKYSWQVIGISTQTSHTLLQNLLSSVSTEDNKSAYKMCIKYSWQIIGISTQASLHDYNDLDYWNGMLLTPSKNCNENEVEIGNAKTYVKPQDYAIYPEKRLKRYLILNNQQTQTFAEKEVQADPNDFYAKYSWHNLIKQYLQIVVFPDMEQILETLTKQKSDKLKLEQINYDELLHKYMIKPLTPNISSKKSVILDNSNERTKKEELLMRLTYALKRLNQYEQNIDKRSTDVQCLDTEDTFVQKKEILPQNVEENIKGIMQSAQEYIAKLDYQLKDLDNADQQIENSMMKTLKDIDETFQSLLDDVCYKVNKRREQLILEAEIHKQESLIPLRACRREVEAQVQNAQNIISMSEDILRNPRQYNANGFGKIISASNDIGRIPAVPYSEELPNINFDRPLNSYNDEIVEQISKLGCISHTIPVQIMNVEERPAGLFVKWHVINPEYYAEEQTFVIEKADGEIIDPTSSKFETVYRGSETSCFIRNIPVDQPVTLRVKIQADNVARSVHHVVRTSIPPYSWELDNENYMITNGKTVIKVTDTISTLFSRGPQFDANHIIEFKFLEVPQEGNDDEGIALVYDPQGSHDTLKRVASLMITPQGKIFMDGDEKLMRLPRMRFGSVIMISTFRKSAHVLRVNIESENKCVTYDWRIQTPLYLAARFTEHNKWHLTIE